jgi:hypothetical protein
MSASQLKIVGGGGGAAKNARLNVNPQTGGGTSPAQSAATGTVSSHVLIAVADREAERQETMTALNTLKKDVAGLVRQIKKLKETPITSAATINTLATFGLTVRKPIPIIIQGCGEDFSASFLDANIGATGDTAQEAFHNLCDILAAKYSLFESLPGERLGREPARQFAVMREFIGRN